MLGGRSSGGMAQCSRKSCQPLSDSRVDVVDQHPPTGLQDTEALDDITVAVPLIEMHEDNRAIDDIGRTRRDSGQVGAVRGDQADIVEASRRRRMCPIMFSDTSVPIHSRHRGATAAPTRPTPAPISSTTSSLPRPTYRCSTSSVEATDRRMMSSSMSPATARLVSSSDVEMEFQTDLY
jgi:hypothetical protein